MAAWDCAENFLQSSSLSVLKACVRSLEVGMGVLPGFVPLIGVNLKLPFVNIWQFTGVNQMNTVHLN